MLSTSQKTESPENPGFRNRFEAILLETFFFNTCTFTAALTQVVELGATHFTRLVQYDRIDIRRQDREQTLNAHAIRDLAYGKRGGSPIALHLDHIPTEALDTLFATLYDLIVNGHIITCLERRMAFLRGQLVVYKLNCCVHNFNFCGRQR